MRILLTGARGQVGRAIAELATDDDAIELITPPRSELDLADPDSIKRAFRDASPEFIINAGAYTAVDDAESHRDEAFAINATGPQALAQLAGRAGVPMIHYSTDYVFSGSTTRPHRPGDGTNPLNVYGASKLAGEQAVLSSGCSAVVLRISWIYAPTGRNFLNTMTRLARERDEVQVVNDQFGAPTPASCVASWTLDIARQVHRGKANPGLYHAAPAGKTSWHGFAQRIFDILASEGHRVPRLAETTTDAFPTPAARPRSSVMDTSSTTSTFGIVFHDWSEYVAPIVRRHLQATNGNADS